MTECLTRYWNRLFSGSARRRIDIDKLHCKKITITQVTNKNFLIAHFATIYENIISLHVSLTFGTVCQTVVDVSTINQFKARLDKFWLHQDILYDYTADLTGIGDRSVGLHVTKDE